MGENKELNVVGQQMDVVVIEMGMDDRAWIQNFIHTDGLHPNERGHRLIADKVRDCLFAHFGIGRD